MKAYFRDALPALTRLITGNRGATALMRYYWETLDGMVPPERVRARWFQPLCKQAACRLQRHSRSGWW